MNTIYCMIYKCVLIGLYHILYTNIYIFIKTNHLTNAHSLIYLFVRSHGVFIIFHIFTPRGFIRRLVLIQCVATCR